MATVTVCDFCSSSEEDDHVELCAGDCFSDICSACANKAGYCEDCAKKAGPQLDPDNPLFNPKPIKDFDLLEIA